MRHRSLVLLLAIVPMFEVACSTDEFGTVDAGGDASTDAATVGDAKDAAVDSGPRTGPFYVFVSSQKHNGAFGGINTGVAGGDAFCQSAADVGTALDGGVAGRKWRAWLSSTKVDAREHVGTKGGALPQYVLVDGTTVFPKGFVFGSDPDDGGKPIPRLPSSAINVDENGVGHAADIVWTGTAADGTFATSSCTDWSDGVSASGTAGNTASAAGWSQVSFAACAQSYRVYCFEVE